jgi:hypothetical protein
MLSIEHLALAGGQEVQSAFRAQVGSWNGPYVGTEPAAANPKPVGWGGLAVSRMPLTRRIPAMEHRVR